MPERLNRCPFCAGHHVEIGNTFPPFQVQCKDCGAQGPPSNDWTLARLAWNAASLEWTKTPPGKAGFYFYRNLFGCVQVLNFRPHLTLRYGTSGEWAGPIPLPVEPNIFEEPEI